MIDTTPLLPQTDEPLIWTTRGNVPVASLTKEALWERTDDYVKLTTIWRASDGEIVKQGVDVLGLKPLELIVEQAALA